MADLPADLPSDLPSKPLTHSRRSSSGSTLSSAESLPSDYIATGVGELANQDQTSHVRPATAGAQRQAPARAASSRATRLSGITQHFRQPSAVGANPLGHQDLGSELTPYTGENARARKQKLTLANQPSQNDAEIEEERRKLESQLIRSRNDWKAARVGDDIRSNVDDHKRINPPKAMELYTGPPPPVIHPNALLPSAAEVSSPASYNGVTITVNGTTRKRPYDDYLSDQSELSSMESLSPPPPPAHIRLSAGASSTRASTPRAAKANPMPLSRKRPRTMGSPRKFKVGANYFAAARAGVGKESAVANGADASEQKADNDDSCRACGGPHEPDSPLVCCDGCTNSFHPDCLEPPVASPKDLPDIWYCPECESKQRGPAALSSSLVSSLIDHVNDMYPRAYNLPHDIRNYFENVKTGEEGEYIEDQPPATNKKGQPRPDNNGALKRPDYKALYDSKGKARLCYKCGQGTEGKREMIPCDYCNNEWHIDCLDPPAATIPKHFNPEGKAPNWRCPHHIEDDLKRYGRPMGAKTGELGRRPRIRRPKNAIPKEHFVPARIPNNGVIDVQLDPEEPDLGIKTIEMGGVVFKVAEKQIKLDFLAAAKNHFYDDITVPQSLGVKPTKFHSKHYLPTNPRFRDAPASPSGSEVNDFDFAESDVPAGTQPTPAIIADEETRIRAQAIANAQLRNKTLIEQRVVIGLTELARKDAAENGSTDDTFGDHIAGLTNRLIADAPEEIFDMINTSEADEFERIARIAQRKANELRGYSKQLHKDNYSQLRNSKTKETQSAKVNGTLGHDHRTS